MQISEEDGGHISIRTNDARTDVLFQCDSGNPCLECPPSHLRLWQVPCTRLDIKGIGSFTDFEGSVVSRFSTHNVGYFEGADYAVSITHGYGCAMTLMARKVDVQDDSRFQFDWKEWVSGTPLTFSIATERLSLGNEGVPAAVLSNYLDQHIDDCFEIFLDSYYEGMPFISEFLKTAYRFYLKERHPLIRKGLKLIITYNLNQHVTLMEQIKGASATTGKINEISSILYGKTLAPKMISFQVRCFLADKWRALQKELLGDLSCLYTGLYTHETFKDWPVIFLLSGMLLIIWEKAQFNRHYYVAVSRSRPTLCLQD